MKGRMEWVAALGLGLASAAAASDGVIEINQARAEAGGVTASDTMGFPVTLDAPGSYRLTGNLVVPDQNTTAIVVDADDVTIDLGGFAIQGTAVCSGTPGSISCSNAGTGNGIHATVTTIPSPARSDGTMVRNGTIRGMGNYGIEVRDAAWVDGVRVEHCASSGVRAEDDSLVTDSRIRWVGGAGLIAVSGTVVYHGNRIALTGGFNQIAATATGGNSCDDGRCLPPVLLRHYYLTTGSVMGDAVLTACDTGFHVASLMELSFPSSLYYDTTRGQVFADSGGGPPTRSGWIRTGNFVGDTSFDAGRANCNLWTSALGGDQGTVVSPLGTWALAAQGSHPWSASTTPCSNPRAVWCIQD